MNVLPVAGSIFCWLLVLPRVGGTFERLQDLQKQHFEMALSAKKVVASYVRRQIHFIQLTSCCKDGLVSDLF